MSYGHDYYSSYFDPRRAEYYPYYEEVIEPSPPRYYTPEYYKEIPHPRSIMYTPQKPASVYNSYRMARKPEIAFDVPNGKVVNSYKNAFIPTKTENRAIPMSHSKTKPDFYKTELCTNYNLNGKCNFGNKCMFAHGIEDLRPRLRSELFKTQMCCDPARSGSRKCMYGRRCNYCHPGEAIRTPQMKSYLDKGYYQQLKEEYGTEYPFGIYV